MMDRHAELTLLRDRFAAAADRWPCLESVLIRWSEALPTPEIRIKNLPDGSANDGEYHFIAVGYGMRTDTPEGRYRDGYAGALLLHRAFASATVGGAMEVSVSDNEASDQWRQLSHRAAQLTPRVELSAATMRWTGKTRWRLICHELCEVPWRPMPGQEPYEQQLITDVFLESATTINKLLVSSAEHLTSEGDVAGHADAKATSWSELMPIAELAKQFKVVPRTINRWSKGETVGPVEVRKVGTRWQYRHRSE